MPKRIVLAAAVAAALALPATALAVPRSTAHRYRTLYHAVAVKYGARAPGRFILRDGLSTGHAASAADLRRSIGVLHRMLHPAPVAHVTRTAYHAASVDGDGDHDGDVSDARSAPLSPRRATVHPASATAVPAAPAGSGGLSSVPGVPAGFAACVAYRESTNGAGSPNIYGIIPASGYNVAGMSVAQQKAIFAQLYAKDGTAPWAPYDGC